MNKELLRREKEKDWIEAFVRFFVENGKKKKM